MTPILDGIKVVDVSQVAAVPMAARILADFGADVIHVEHPVLGDHFRVLLDGMAAATGIQSEINYVWEHYNRNKKSVTVDLSRDGGRKILYKMLGGADVFLTNLRPFELEKFHVDYETLKGMNPRLVAAYLTGYGRKGPANNNPAYDHTAYWARSGIPHRVRSLSPELREPGVSPPAFIPSFGDHMAAMSLVSGVMMALYDREKSATGREINVSLFHAGVYQLSFDISGALATGQDCMNRLSREENPNALTGQYRTKDDRWVLMCILRPDRYWSQFCKAIGREELEKDPRFATAEAQTENHVALMEILDQVFLEKTLDQWRPTLDAERLPWAPVQNLVEVTRDPQARANDFFVTYQHPDHGTIEGVQCPIQIAEHPTPVRNAAPEFGQHTEEVLLELGYTWEDIVQFKEQGVIA